MSEIIYKEESYRIIGACFEVYKEMGCGFLEPVYQECLEMELALQSLPFHPQTELKLIYKGRLLISKYIPDFILFDKGAGVEKLMIVRRVRIRNQNGRQPQGRKFRER